MNKNGSKTIYVYSSPIRYLNEENESELIDIRLTNVTQKDFLENNYFYTVVSNDIIPFYPEYLSSKKGVKLKNNIEYEIGIYSKRKVKSKVGEFDNFIGTKKNMAYYKNGKSSTIYFYPSNIGTNCEIKFNSNPESNVYNLLLKVSDESLTLRKESDGTIVIYDSRT